jgi:hypothetical protein
MERRTSFGNDVTLCVGLIAVGTFSRLALQDIPNFAPVARLALFAGYACRSRWMALGVPLATLAITDQVIGGYAWQLRLSVYGLLAAPVLMSVWIRRVTRNAASCEWSPLQAISVGGACLASSLLFFFGSNIAVWATSTWYPHNFTGLLECLTNALPFFRYTLGGDLVFGLGSFGALAGWRALARLSVTESAPAFARATGPECGCENG